MGQRHRLAMVDPVRPFDGGATLPAEIPATGHQPPHLRRDGAVSVIPVSAP